MESSRRRRGFGSCCTTGKLNWLNNGHWPRLLKSKRDGNIVRQLTVYQDVPERHAAHKQDGTIKGL